MSRRRSILIADDSDDVVVLLQKFLRPLDCEILSARDGEQALTLAQTHVPDVVLLDVMMPRRSGWEVCQALKSVARTAHIAVVLITGRGDVKDRLTGLQLGADDYLVKPFDRDEVLKRVGALLERERAETREAAQSGRNALEAMMIDRATALPTLPVVLDHLKEMLIEQGELGIVFIDIEQYESIESEFGWAFFDEFLRRTAEFMTAEAERRFHKPLLTCDRLAGSSFFIFFETKGGDLKQENAFHAAATELRAALVANSLSKFPMLAAAQVGFFVGASRVDYRPQSRLERQIYHGMRAAADAVRDAEQQEKRQLSRELRDIIRRKRVTTLFQPIVWASDRTVFGYEILTRGPANSSFLNSDILFAFAREAKLAWALEAIALDCALRRLRTVDLQDRKFLLNLEAEMFSESEFHIHDMASFFAEHPGQFVLELTERAAIEDYAAFRELIDGFRAKGIQVAIDDAGSGYASLEAIAALSPDYLKITKSLVSTVANEPIKQDLVRMLVELANRIGAKTIAEGIETVEEYETCRDLGIDLIQGYFFAHPQESLLLGDEEVQRALESY